MDTSKPEEEALLASSSTPTSPISPLSPSISRSPILPLSQPGPSRSRLNARKMSGLSEKLKGKQRDLDTDVDLEKGHPGSYTPHKPRRDSRTDVEEVTGSPGKSRLPRPGRHVTVVFSNEADSGGGNLELWVEDGESVGSVKDQIRHLRPTLAPLSLRLIHAGRLLTDGILLLPWLRSLEERVRRQAGGVGGDVEEVLREVGLQDEESSGPAQSKGDGDQSTGKKSKGKEKDRVWLHCNVGPKMEDVKGKDKEEGEEPSAPRRRGFDVLLDAGLSPADVANMRRQFYESRGEEVPEGMDLGDVNDEHARALEEQWIEGDMTAETATTTTEGMYTSILHGLLTGFLFPLSPWFFFRELPLPNFFDSDADARGEDDSPVSARVSGNPDVGGEFLPSVVFGKRMQMGILLGTFINLAFGWLRFLN